MGRGGLLTDNQSIDPPAVEIDDLEMKAALVEGFARCRNPA
jgi:hypothetical protein